MGPDSLLEPHVDMRGTAVFVLGSFFFLEFIAYFPPTFKITVAVNFLDMK